MEIRVKEGNNSSITVDWGGELKKYDNFWVFLQLSESWMSIDTRQIRDFFITPNGKCPFLRRNMLPERLSRARQQKRTIKWNTQQDKYPLASNYFTTACWPKRLRGSQSRKKKSQAIKWWYECPERDKIYDWTVKSKPSEAWRGNRLEKFSKQKLKMAFTCVKLGPDLLLLRQFTSSIRL